MSRCGRTNHLEAMVAGELGVTTERELRAHADTCTRCRHELRWLESERRLFRQRASREEVSELWQGVSRRSGPQVGRPWVRVMVALAASLLVALGLGRLTLPRHPSAHATAGELSGGVDWSEASEGGFSSLQPESALTVCSTLPEGLGFHCGPAVPASFLASR